MKNSISIKKLAGAEVWYSTIIATLCIMAGMPVFAQNTVPEKVDVDINTGSDAAANAGWYAQPWAWVVGVAVFIIIIIAITRNGSARREDI